MLLKKKHSAVRAPLASECDRTLWFLVYNATGVTICHTTGERFYSYFIIECNIPDIFPLIFYCNLPILL